jgi:type VI secretion system secreted protein Hcp
MPSPIYMQISAVQRGDVSAGAMSEQSVGRLSKARHVDRIQVQAYDSDISLPRDIQTGMPTGRRVHKGITVHKIFDKASPDLYAILASGEELNFVTLEFWRTAPTGIEEQYFEIKAERCSIVQIHTYVPNCLDPQLSHMGHMEAVTMSYRRITWTHKVAGNVSSDDWDR